MRDKITFWLLGYLNPQGFTYPKIQIVYSISKGKKIEPLSNSVIDY